jgi:hypothetical protein
MNEISLMKMEDALEKAKWKYCGVGQWLDPQTDTTLPSVTAFKVMTQRASRIKILKSSLKNSAPNILLCSDWRGITKEIRKQLKPHGLTIKLRNRKWSEYVIVEVAKIPPPKPVKCPDCGLMSDDNRCCANDESLWK